MCFRDSVHQTGKNAKVRIPTAPLVIFEALALGLGSVAPKGRAAVNVTATNTV
jgi:hypothetical protein